MRLRQVVAASFPVIHSKKADRFRAFHPNTLIYPTKLSWKKNWWRWPPSCSCSGSWLGDLGYILVVNPVILGSADPSSHISAELGVWAPPGMVPKNPVDHGKPTGTYQRVSRISEPSTGWRIIYPSFHSWLFFFQKNVPFMLRQVMISIVSYINSIIAVSFPTSSLLQFTKTPKTENTISYSPANSAGGIQLEMFKHFFCIGKSIWTEPKASWNCVQTVHFQGFSVDPAAATRRPSWLPPQCRLPWVPS